MCQKSMNKIHSSNKTSSLPVYFIGFVVVFTILLFIDSAGGRNEIKKSRGACLSYGHACWGAHGKRSGNEIPIFPVNHNNNNNDAEEMRHFQDNGKSKTRWFLSRLLTPMDLRFASGDYPQSLQQQQQQQQKQEQEQKDTDTFLIPKVRGEIKDFFLEKEGEKRLNDWENIEDMKSHSDDDPLENRRDLENLFNYRKFMEKRSIES